MMSQNVGMQIARVRFYQIVQVNASEPRPEFFTLHVKKN